MSGLSHDCRSFALGAYNAGITLNMFLSNIGQTPPGFTDSCWLALVPLTIASKTQNHGSFYDLVPFNFALILATWTRMLKFERIPINVFIVQKKRKSRVVRRRIELIALWI